jgi:hypothetical protein
LLFIILPSAGSTYGRYRGPVYSGYIIKEYPNGTKELINPETDELPKEGCLEKLEFSFKIEAQVKFYRRYIVDIPRIKFFL